MMYPQLRRRRSTDGQLLQTVAGVFALAAGGLLVLSVPLTMFLLERYHFGLYTIALWIGAGLYLVCSLGAHFLFAFGAFWGGYRGIKFLLESGSLLLLLGVSSFLAAFFLLGSFLDFVASALLVWAGVLVYLS